MRIICVSVNVSVKSVDFCSHGRCKNKKGVIYCSLIRGWKECNHFFVSKVWIHVWFNFLNHFIYAPICRDLINEVLSMSHSVWPTGVWWKANCFSRQRCIFPGRYIWTPSGVLCIARKPFTWAEPPREILSVDTKFLLGPLPSKCELGSWAHPPFSSLRLIVLLFKPRLKNNGPPAPPLREPAAELCSLVKSHIVQISPRSIQISENIISSNKCSHIY